MELLSKIKTEIVNPAIYLLLALAAVYFVYGVFVFVSTDDDKVREEGKKHMIWGVVGIAIMLSVKGIIATIRATIN
ncbi:hypothetical protein KJ973_02145 [Patescibacteria group bacterium]|nr:hypothetical protein [Patescibacteria group bacterium]MBU1519469.1 hypothetical protein [Patescibacteria group bacterium]MBU1730559.1 hypothetical protein [Patescibacteria group bacterium]MBU2010404.1 hypothetical protein [Patescibacteria group bacterium]MBU2416503.1 hypothetical protein [Patescibacteria group bacterium]